MSDDISIEVPANTEWARFFHVLEAAFHEEVTPEASAAEEMIFEADRGLVARRDGDIVGTAAILTRQMAVPGGVVPAAHVTLVSVAPTARRQGVLTRFMKQQFRDARAAGEPIAALWASEARIYQRFGYGLGSTRLRLTVDSREVELLLPPAGGRLREGTPSDLRDVVVKLYDEVYRQRPGWSERAARHWDYRLIDFEAARRGATSLRTVIHEGEHGVDGYALWRANGRWGESGPAGEVRLVELVTTTPDAYAALWRYLMSIDLTRTVDVWTCATDEPLLAAVNEPRKLEARIIDALWIRVIDLPAALAARRYATDVDVVLEVTDALIPENAGRWRVTGSPTAATCVSTVDEPDLSLDIRALGAAYLGGTSLAGLAATGRVTEHHQGALDRASIAFGWYRAPSAVEIF